MSTKPEDVTSEAADGLKEAKRTARRLKTAFKSLGMDDFTFQVIERTNYDMYKSRYGVLASQRRRADAERPPQGEHQDIRDENGVLLVEILVYYYDSKELENIRQAIALANSDVEKCKKVENGFHLLDGFSATTEKDTASGDSEWENMSDGSFTEETGESESVDGEWNLL